MQPVATSTIVMGLLTCVPFGLAIRDTVTGDNGGSGARAAYDDETYDDHESSAAFEARMRALEEAEAEEERLEEAARAERAQQLVSLYGAEPASLGPAFAGIRLGVNEAELDGAALAGLYRTGRSTGTKIDLEAVTGIVHRIVIDPALGASEDDEEALCEALDQRLRTAWGEGTERDERRQWAHPLSGQRATLITDPSCRYVVERYAPVTAWLGKDKAAVVPVWAIGQPAQRLLDVLGDRAQVDDDAIMWRGPGLDGGLGDTTLTAYTERGKVVTLEAGSDGVPSALARQLTTTYGEPVDADDEVARWKGKPPISLQVAGGYSVFVTVGKHE